MPDEEVPTFLLFTDPEEATLGDAFDAVRKLGWELSYWSEESEFDDGLRHDPEAVSSALAESYDGYVGLERGYRTAQLGRNYGAIPTAGITDVFLDEQCYDFEYGPGGPDKADADETVSRYLGVVKALTEALEPDYGYGKRYAAVDPAAVPTRDDLIAGRVYDIFWLNVFGPRFVRRLGRKRLLGAPAWHVEELSTGHIVLVASDNPVQPAEKWEGQEAVVTASLGLD